LKFFIERLKNEVNLVVTTSHGQINTENNVNLKFALKNLNLDLIKEDDRTAYVKLYK
jgi:phosphate starvation-inducible protein PhoH